MSELYRTAGRWTLSFTLATGILLMNSPLALAGPGDINSTNNGQIVQAGTYYNTAGSKTTFTNTAGTGLHVRAGDTVVGREVDGGGALTGNGGWLHFNAPGQVVRIDGTVDVSGIMSGGVYTGNGGRVTIDSGFLYQNGQIYANGVNAGSVQMNVGAMTMGDGAVIQARGNTGALGNQSNIDIKSTNGINMAQGAIIDASGNFVGSYNTNVINIEGGLVNLAGIVQADAMSATGKAGTIGITAVGVAKSTANVANAIGNSNLLTSSEKSALIAMTDWRSDPATFSALNGSVAVLPTGKISANGADGASGVDATDGGIVRVSAVNNFINDGEVSSNGGNGFNGYNPSNGGNGGLVEISTGNHIANLGRITSNGGNGGSNPNAEVGPVVDMVDGDGNVIYDGNGTPRQQQVSFGQDGGTGGNGGGVVFSYGKKYRGATVDNTAGVIEVRGGNGGNGQDATSTDNGAVQQYAFAGNGGNAGNGGLVDMTGGIGAKLPSQATLANINVNGGSGGAGGKALTSSSNGSSSGGAGGKYGKNDCGCDKAKDGTDGACGVPGQIKYRVTNIPGRPPETPPQSPYPREYQRMGENLPGNLGPVLSYNRSIFLARAPLPIIKKRKTAPVMMAETPAPKPAPKPPQRKATVRGYW